MRECDDPRPTHAVAAGANGLAPEAIARELAELRDQLRAVLDADRPPSTEPQVYGLHTAAEALGVSPNTVRRLVVQGQLTGTTVNGATQIDAADIARYLAASRRQARR